MTARRKTAEPEQAQASMPMPVAEGVHLHMPESVYFGAGALGSSDLKMLYWDAPSWWASSRFNLERREPERITRSVAKNLGTGLHALVIEGEDAYTSKFVVEPDAASNRYAKTRKAMTDFCGPVSTGSDAIVHGAAAVRRGALDLGAPMPSRVVEPALTIRARDVARSVERDRRGERGHSFDHPTRVGGDKCVPSRALVVGPIATPVACTALIFTGRHADHGSARLRQVDALSAQRAAPLKTSLVVVMPAVEAGARWTIERSHPNTLRISSASPAPVR